MVTYKHNQLFRALSKFMNPEDGSDFEDDDTIVDDEEANEEDNDSEKKNVESGEEDSKNIPPADDKVEAKTNYRPSDGEKDSKVQTVPLKKYMELKTKYKEAVSSGESPKAINKTLEKFATDSGLNLEVVTELASLIVSQANEEANRIADEKIKPIVMEKTSKANIEAFENDFKMNIVEKYPELATKIETFKKVAFSKDFLHLPTLEDIKNEFFPDAKPVTKEVKKDVIEGGSQGASKNVERIEFTTLKDNPKQYAKVMADPVAREKYYAWQDSQV